MMHTSQVHSVFLTFIPNSCAKYVCATICINAALVSQ